MISTRVIILRKLTSFLEGVTGGENLNGIGMGIDFEKYDFGGTNSM